MYSEAKCNLPIFMLQHDDEANYCGKRKAMTICIGITVVIVILSIIATLLLTKNKEREIANELVFESDIEERKKIDEQSRFIWWPLIVGVIFIVLLWVFGPKMFLQQFMTNFSVKKLEREVMTKRGLSEKESFQQQQKLYESRQQADSRIQAAQIQANALNNAFKNKFRYRY
jgi:hypothetical protein